MSLPRSFAFDVALELLSEVDHFKSSEMYAIVSSCLVVAVRSPQKSDALMRLIALQRRLTESARVKRWRQGRFDVSLEYLKMLLELHSKIDVEALIDLIHPTRDQYEQVVLFRDIQSEI